MGNILEQLLEERDVLLADGGMGTGLFELGLANGLPGERWNLDHPERVEVVHRGFVEAGSDIVLTNTFGANPYRFRLHKGEAQVRETNLRAVEIARRAARAAARPVVVGGSVGPSGEMLQPLGERTAEEVEDAFVVQMEALRDAGADLAWIETMFFEDEVAAAARAAERAGLAYVITMTFDTGGRTMMGLVPEKAARLPDQRGWRPLAFGANCGVGPAQLLDTVLGLRRGAPADAIIVAKANCGIPEVADDMKVRYSGTPEVMAAYAVMARDAGARIIGGCCGTTPAHLAAMRQALDGTPRGSVPSYSEIERQLGPVKNVSAVAR